MAKFKVGDQVRVTGDSMGWHHEAKGEISTIVEVLDGLSGGYPSAVGYHLDSEWEVAEEDLEPAEKDLKLVETPGVQIWSQYVDELAQACKALENVAFPKGELTFEFPARINVTLYGEPSGYALVRQDGAWYIEVGE